MRTNRSLVFCAPMSAGRIKAASENPQRGKPLRVLIVEDDPVTRRMLCTLLEKQGYVIVLANHGPEALARYQAERFDLVFTDAQMPKMDGLTLTAALRKVRPSGTHVPIVGVSGHLEEGDRERFLAVGMDGLLLKPIFRSVLTAEIERLLGNPGRIKKLFVRRKSSA